MGRCLWGSGHSPHGARRYLSYDRSSGATIDRTIDREWLPLVVRSSTIVVDRATTRTTNRTMTYHQQERPIAVCDRFWRSEQTLPIDRTFDNSNQSYDQQIVRSGVTVALSPSHTRLLTTRLRPICDRKMGQS